VRVVIDTNVWVSALLNRSGRPAEVLASYRDGRFDVVTAAPLLDEIKYVLTRPRLAKKYGVTPDDADELVALLRQRAEVVALTDLAQVCRDPDDDAVLGAAVAGKADAVVTRDEDISRDPASLDHLAAVGIRVLTVQQFLSELGF
jgi:putative PIN family toxin of toxin-antitoxin system